MERAAWVPRCFVGCQPGKEQCSIHSHSTLARHAELVAHDTELMSVFGRHCTVGEDKELGR